MKRPSFQFYPGDWMRSTDLRSCSVGARGLWMDMLCLMHEGTPYGHLKVNSVVIKPVNLARMVGASVLEVEGWLQELEMAGVSSKGPDGIFSRRMVRDEQLRVKRINNGRLGGNPSLTNSKDHVDSEVNHQDNTQLKQMVADEDEDEEKERVGVQGKRKPRKNKNVVVGNIPVELNTTDFREAWSEWLLYRHQIKKPLSDMSITQQFRDFTKLGPEKSVLIIRQSIRNGWQGLFEPSGGHNSKTPISGPTLTEEQRQAARQRASDLTQNAADIIAADLAAKKPVNEPPLPEVIAASFAMKNVNSRQQDKAVAQRAKTELMQLEEK